MFSLSNSLKSITRIPFSLRKTIDLTDNTQYLEGIDDYVNY